MHLLLLLQVDKFVLIECIILLAIDLVRVWPLTLYCFGKSQDVTFNVKGHILSVTKPI